MQPGRHIPVLMSEVLASLAPRPGDIYLDCTAGLGGHAAAVAERLGPTGSVVLNDLDPENLRAAEAKVRGSLPALGGGGQIVVLHGNYADAPRRLAEAGLAADLVLADVGFASNQVERAERGFSFSREGPLDMRLDPTAPVTAAELVASLPERDLGEVLREYGEEREWRRIARKLVEERKVRPISTTGQLAEVVRAAIGRRPTGGINPATRTFQALRIAVNDELGSLSSLMEAVRRGAEACAAGRESWLRPGARVAVICFHSLEDRIVKRAFADLASRGIAEPLTRKPVEAGEQEVRANARSRSAKLRAVRIVGSSGAP